MSSGSSSRSRRNTPRVGSGFTGASRPRSCAKAKRSTMQSCWRGLSFSRFVRRSRHWLVQLAGRLLHPEVLLDETQGQIGSLPFSNARVDFTFDAELVHPFLQDLAEFRVVNADALALDGCVQLAGVDQLCRCVVLRQVVDGRDELE